MAISLQAMERLTKLTERAQELYHQSVVSNEGFKPDLDMRDVCSVINELAIHTKQLQLEVVNLYAQLLCIDPR